MTPLRALWSECLRHATVKYPGMALSSQVQRLTHALTAFLNHLDNILDDDIVQKRIQNHCGYLRTLKDVPPPKELELTQWNK